LGNNCRQKLPKGASPVWRVDKKAQVKPYKTVPADEPEDIMSPLQLAKLTADVGRGQAVSSHVGTLGELIERWLEAITPERSAYTIQGYRRLVKEPSAPPSGPSRAIR
jgi:hypothetical protein